MTPSPPDLGGGELEVLKALWHLGPSTVREAREHLADRGRELAYNTVQTVLRRLVDKGFVSVDTSEHSHVFRARKTRDQIGKRRVRELLQGVYDGAAGSLAAQLIRNGRVQPDEIDELQGLLDQLVAKNRRKR